MAGGNSVSGCSTGSDPKILGINLSHVSLKESSVPASPFKEGKGWHTLMSRLATAHLESPTIFNSHLPQWTRHIDLPFHPSIKTFAVSNMSLQDIHKVAQF
ncbi:hypothetical protein J6590_032535 [Homalodisca vitripennis]|nr:hypothetical protein J6590_032535 [Homalodisca vitripennis]